MCWSSFNITFKISYLIQYVSAMMKPIFAKNDTYNTCLVCPRCAIYAFSYLQCQLSQFTLLGFLGYVYDENNLNTLTLNMNYYEKRYSLQVS
jgi:hypothetical protein